ncbi:MAG TPA: hypothetical protein ENJ09_12500, partial [Planctomycetes bacterium]|nr:hypothetical protein [Planctomycetota bacterium]
MNLTIQSAAKACPKTDLLVVLATEEGKLELPDGVKLAPLAKKAFGGEFREARLTDSLSGPAARVLAIGLGKRKDADTERLRRAGAIAAKKAEKVRAGSLVIWCSPAIEKAVGGAEAAGDALAQGAVMGTYAMGFLKSDKKKPYLKRITLSGGGAPFRRGAKHGDVLGRANCFTRRLQDTPGNLMRPRDLVREARKIAGKSTAIRMKALDEKAMGALGMGSLLSVSKGSSEPAYLIHLSYKPKRKAKKKLCVVGKGLTFDAGGISLKPSAKMDEMKYDMSGGAAVLGLFHALAELDLPVEVHGLVPTSENLPDGKANKPGDVVTAMNGKTIEVLNTDAEGRLILADALCYAEKKVKPDAIVDLATLTGAVIVALGHELTGVMGSDEKLQDALVASGKATGEAVWKLPLL